MSPQVIHNRMRAKVIEGRTTRDPNESEARTIERFMLRMEKRTGQLPIGAWPVRGVGDVLFSRLPVNAAEN